MKYAEFVIEKSPYDWFEVWQQACKAQIPVTKAEMIERLPSEEAMGERYRKWGILSWEDLAKATRLMLEQALKEELDEVR